MRDLSGRVAVVTGGASGIGFALANALGREGMRVVIADVEKDALGEAVDLLRAQKIEATGIPADVADGQQVETLAARTVELYGGVHVVCNNAGVGPGGVTWDVPESVWRWVLDVNLWGVINGIRAFVPRLVAQGAGHIVNTASVLGILGSAGMAPYTASKHAIVGLSESLRHDLDLAGSPVRVSVLCPAMTKTRMNESGRNWPERLGPVPASGLEPGHPDTRALEYYHSMETEAMEPAEVAKQVVAAITEDRFWVICDPDIEKRFSTYCKEALL